MTGIIQAKGGGGERCTEIKNIEVPDLWHIAMRLSERGDPVGEKMVLETWHLAHDMKNCLVVLDKVLPSLLGRATERLQELITDIQEMGDIERGTVINLIGWAEDLESFVGIFSHFAMGGDFMGQERNNAEHYIALALKLAEEINNELDDPEEEVDSRYNCPCGHSWVSTWTCACNDKCPKCNKEIEGEVIYELP